jgi:hypothetical protein
VQTTDDLIPNSFRGVRHAQCVVPESTITALARQRTAVAIMDNAYRHSAK